MTGAIIGAVLLVAAICYGVYALFTGMRDKAYPYFGKNISRADHPVAFWVAMALTIIAMLLAARALPEFLVVLL